MTTNGFSPLLPHMSYDIHDRPPGHPSEWLVVGETVAIEVYGAGTLHLMVSATSSVHTACEFTAHGVLHETDQTAQCTFYHPLPSGRRQTLRIV